MSEIDGPKRISPIFPGNTPLQESTLSITSCTLAAAVHMSGISGNLDCLHKQESTAWLKVCAYKSYFLHNYNDGLFF